jgi:hypothetical protein
MTESTRQLRDPVVQPDGSLLAQSVATPTSFKVRGRIESDKVVPVISVPGIMGAGNC